MKGIPTSCIQYYSPKNDISVLDIYLQLFNGKPIEFDLTNDNNKCVFETIKIIQLNLYIKVIKERPEHVNSKEMKMIKYLLIDVNFICLIIYNGRNHKRSV